MRGVSLIKSKCQDILKVQHFHKEQLPFYWQQHKRWNKQEFKSRQPRPGQRSMGSECCREAQDRLWQHLLSSWAVDISNTETMNQLIDEDSNKRFTWNKSVIWLTDSLLWSFFNQRNAKISLISSSKPESSSFIWKHTERQLTGGHFHTFLTFYTSHDDSVHRENSQKTAEISRCASARLKQKEKPQESGSPFYQPLQSRIWILPS